MYDIVRVREKHYFFVDDGCCLLGFSFYGLRLDYLEVVNVVLGDLVEWVMFSSVVGVMLVELVFWWWVSQECVSNWSDCWGL